MNSTNNLILSRKAPYLKTLLNPFSGPSSIPDDISARHVIKGETVTNNISGKTTIPGAKTCDGLYVFYLGHPTSYVGVHYTYDSVDQRYKFDSYIKTAQDLTKSYDYCRAVSCGVNIISNTISTTNFTISGTFNAATIDGTLTEIGFDPVHQTPTDFYEKILSATSNIQDKIGNVLMAHGVTALALPTSFNIPYTRMSDPFPYQNMAGMVFATTTSEIVDNSAELIYTLSAAATTTTTWLKNGPVYITLDNFTGPMTAAVTIVSAAGATDVAHQFSMQMTAYSPFGETVAQLVSSNVDVAGSDFNWSFDFDAQQPIGRLAFTNLGTSITGNPNDINDIKDVLITARTPNGARPGIAAPTTVVVYNGFPVDARMTISGVKNFELIPNPELRRNIGTMYSHYDPNELVYVKQILSQREALGIRSVMTTPMFKANEGLMNEYSELDKNTVADAMDISDIIRGIKNIAVPALSAFMPEIAPFAHTAGALVDALTPNPARAASGWYGMDQKDFKDDELISISSSFEHFDDPGAAAPERLELGSVVSDQPIIPLHNVDIKGYGGLQFAVLFPVLYCTGGIVQKAGLYAVIPGKRLDLLPEASKNIEASCRGSTHKVYGMEHVFAAPVGLKHDMTVVMVDKFSSDHLSIPLSFPHVMGSSAEAAVVMLDMLMAQQRSAPLPGVYGPITGAVEGNFIMKNFMYDVKRSYCESRRLLLLGSGDRNRPRLEYYTKLVNYGRMMGVISNTYETPRVSVIPDTGFEVALAADVSELGKIAKMLETMMSRQDDMERRLSAKVPPTLPIAAETYVAQERNSRSKLRTPIRPQSPSINGDETDDDEPEYYQEPIVFKEDTSREPSDSLMGAIDTARSKGWNDDEIAHVIRTLLPKKVRGPSTDAAQARKFSKIAENMGECFTAEWVRLNGGRAPSSDQQTVYRLTQRAPRPSLTIEGRYFPDSIFFKSEGIRGVGTLIPPSTRKVSINPSGRSKSAQRKYQKNLPPQERIESVIASQANDPAFKHHPQHNADVIRRWIDQHGMPGGPEAWKAIKAQYSRGANVKEVPSIMKRRVYTAEPAQSETYYVPETGEEAPENEMSNEQSIMQSIMKAKNLQKQRAAQFQD